jgi:RND superfamily putative drug exporter
MDCTVFLLSSAKEHRDRSHDPREAMLAGLAHSGRVIFAAGAVMVAAFLTFALSGPLPADGDGDHPRHRGAALLVRLMLVCRSFCALTGQAAWWLPRWLDRLLPDVRFGH